jgi:hypothetical protein
MSFQMSLSLHRWNAHASISQKWRMSEMGVFVFIKRWTTTSRGNCLKILYAAARSAGSSLRRLVGRSIVSIFGTKIDTWPYIVFLYSCDHCWLTSGHIGGTVNNVTSDPPRGGVRFFGQRAIINYLLCVTLIYKQNGVWYLTSSRWNTAPYFAKDALQKCAQFLQAIKDAEYFL